MALLTHEFRIDEVVLQLQRMVQLVLNQLTRVLTAKKGRSCMQAA